MFFDDANTPEAERVLSQIQKAFPDLALVKLTAEKGFVRATRK